MSEQKIKALRHKTAIALVKQINNWGEEISEHDYELDRFYRKIANLPPLPQGNMPLSGFFKPPQRYKRLFCGQLVPEHQLRMHNYVRINCPVLGELILTGGFMEPHGHSYKPACQAIFADKIAKRLKPSNRNYGIDYVTPIIHAWYGGTCIDVQWERGYGNRAYFRWDLNYVHQGIEYAVYGAFAHASSFSIAKGDRVSQGQKIGIQGSSGGNYPPHIDYRMWIVIDNSKFDLSPNALEAQIHA
jgi:murein DD-endopeptidase MepM/ murein hydrolase activator NlpD